MSAKSKPESEPKPKTNARVFKPSERAEAEAAGESIALPFPSEALPPVLRKMAEAVAEIERLPVAMSAPMTLAVASAALGRGVLLRGLRGKLTPGNLFVVVCAESGTGKSSAFRHIVAPLDGMQARILRDFRKDTWPKLEAERKTIALDIQAIETRIKKAGSDGEKIAARDEMRDKLAKMREIEEAMREPLLWTSDSTPESLAERLAANDSTLSQLNPDAGDSFSSMLGCYRDKASRDGSHALWLKCYSNESHTVTRTRGTVHLEKPSLAMLLVVTGSTARRHLEDKSLLETGFLGRLLLCDPRAEMSEAESFEEAQAARALPSDASQPFEASVWKALALYRRPRGLVVPDEVEDAGEAFAPASEIEPFIIEAEEAALRVLWEDRKRQCNAWKEAESERELIARESEQAARIALVLHIFEAMTFHHGKSDGIWKVHSCRGPETKLTGETMRKAIAIRDWFKGSLASMMQGQRDAAKDEAFAKIARAYATYDWHKTGITPRHLTSHRIAATSEQARKLLELWQSEGKLIKRDREHKGTGRKPEPAFFLTAYGGRGK